MKIIQTMKKYSSTIMISVLIMITIILSFSINNSVRNRTLSGSSFNHTEQDKRDREKAYREVLRDFLCGAGFSDSGINMTKTVNLYEQPDGTTDGTVISYTVAIYHRRISELSGEELSSLLTDIVGIDLPIEGSTVSYKFL
ncbi:MAG: hypothetical protein FWE14_09235 [Lachnospiraceae bacterium]|nr:hypothetical protein [Lachnospiraceae bacterium]